ncbi:MAG TPA: polyphosphate kinase 1, partial [Clostridia bacterium]
KWGMAIRLELEHGADNGIVEFLKELEVPSEFTFDIKGPLDLTFLMKLSSIHGFEHLRFPPYYPQPIRELDGYDDIFKAISAGDILLHHPFQSFDPVVEFVKQASEDPRVLAIKQTLYRVSGNSPIVEALAQAAENGKQVTVLVELKARFDEQNNINWAKRLEMAGCHVIYGLVGLKTHCKVLLVVRMEDDGIKRYVHLSTGNYNDITAKIYTDIGLFTANPYFGADASALFNMLSGYSRITRMYKFDIAPVTLRDKFVRLIKHETENALNGKKGHIIAKINSLVDEGIIKALYDASNAGVEIQLIIRGICCIKPGVKGLSERISVRSIVGRYLEHSRIFYFYNNGEELIFLSSSDWMTRNLDRRVELLFPIEDPKIFERIKEILNICLKDTTNARILDGEGVYSKVDKRGKEMINSQQYFSSQAVKEWQETTKVIVEEGFRPNQ